MRQFIVRVLGLLTCILPLATAIAGDKPVAAAPAGKFIVHEWGTFTGLVGSDGGNLPFRSGIGSDLPSFVFTRAEQAERMNPGAEPFFAMELFSKDETLALQRMETPVVYFYTDMPREVSARVQFPKGLLTEFYPPVRLMTPAYDPKRIREVLTDSSLDWGKFRVVPASTSANFPKVEGNNHYAHARATDAATVQFSDKPGEVHEENFLFYRGLGNFHIPVTLTADGRDWFTLHNSTAGRIATAFLIRTTGGKIRFSTYHNVAASQRMTLPSEESSKETLANAVVKALVSEGLYEKEARAMVKTWEANWFGEEGTGTRLLYTLPRPLTDQLLPLHITPTPDETVRVLVGRIDVLTREQEARFAAMFRKTATKEPVSIEEARELRALGRFQRPALDRVAETQVREVLSAVQMAEHTHAKNSVPGLKGDSGAAAGGG